MFYTERVTPVGRHVAELNYSLAEQAGASRPAAPEYPLRVPAGGAASVRARLGMSLGITGDYVVVGPGGSWRAKCWPPERFGEFCREFEQRNDATGRRDSRSGRRIARRGSPARRRAGRNPSSFATTIEELMGLLVACAMPGCGRFRSAAPGCGARHTGRRFVSAPRIRRATVRSHPDAIVVQQGAP